MQIYVPYFISPFFGWFGLFFIVGLIFLTLFIAKSFYLVNQAEIIIIERLGRFHQILKPGPHIIIPFVDKPRTVLWSFVKEVEGRRYYRFSRAITRIDLREAVYDFPKQNVITKDNVTMEINALLYYQITDPKSAIYEVFNLPEAIEKLTQTTLRNVIGSLDLDESLVSRDAINERLRLILDEATDKWGVKVNRVELQEVNPPLDIRQAMEKQMRAERDRRALILEAEGKKRSAILESEGAKESQVLRAEGEASSKKIKAIGEADARLKITEAEAKAITMIRDSIPKGDPLPYMIAVQYIKALPELTKGKNDKLVVIPYEASSLIGSLTSIKTLFEQLNSK
ncbi:SPFH/Band 7/PHB domain protein [Candidatus Dependentiae bacterium]|nr:MAG: SPFH/Band 7/PHB domain protein [Candidatus Dependentiae bacterium]